MKQRNWDSRKRTGEFTMSTKRKRCWIRKHHPKSVPVLKALGSFEMEAESYDAAIEALHAAAAFAPADAGVRICWAPPILERGTRKRRSDKLKKHWRWTLRTSSHVFSTPKFS